MSPSIMPVATAWSSCGKGTERLRSSVCVSILGFSVTPTASTMTKRSLRRRRGDDAQIVGADDHVPRPIICSKSTRDLTARMNSSTSSGLMSVPVAIMSTVTAMRGK